MLRHHGHAFVAGLLLFASVAIAEEPSQPEPTATSAETVRISRLADTATRQDPGPTAENQTQITLSFRMLEYSRTKFVEMSLDAADFPALLRKDSAGNFAFVLVDDPNEVDANVKSLTLKGASILSDSTITMFSGRQATFETGNKLPQPLPDTNTDAIKPLKVGTSIDVTPMLQSDGSLKLDFRLSVSEADSTRTITVAGQEYPGVRSRYVCSRVVLHPHQTLVVRGLVQSQVEPRKVGMQVEGVRNDFEILVLVRADY